MVNLITYLTGLFYAPYSVGDYKFSAQNANHGKWLICQGTGLTNRTLGQVVGSENTTLTTANLPDPLITTGQVTAVRITSANGSALGIGDIAGTASINNTGGNQPFSNMQPTLFGGNIFIFSGV